MSTGDFALPADWLRMPATCHHSDPRLMTLAKTFAEDTPPYAPWLFYLWGHSYEFDMRNDWHVIEEFAAYIGGRDDIWYATNIEVFDYIQAFRCLISSADGRTYHNPSALAVGILANGKAYILAPGESATIG